MKKLVLTAFLAAAFSIAANAQGTDEPYFNLRKFYTQGNYGTARSQAMGGAFTALGGDLSNTYINPAGLGFYNRSEFSGTFNFLGNKTTSTYNGSSEVRSRSPLDLGQLGVVFSKPGTGTRKRRGSFGVSYSTLASFSNSYTYGGTNNSSSIADSFAERANALGVAPQKIYDDYKQYGNTAGNSSEMAVVGGLLHYENGNYFVNEEALPISQRGEVVESGNLGQLNISYGANFDDKTYVGGSLGIQTLRFDRRTKYDETFPASREYLNSLYYDNELSITGAGLNLTLGVIQRLNSTFNLGATLTTPTLTWLNDSFWQSGGVSAVNQNAVMFETSAQTAVDEFKYRVTSPLKFNLGVSAFLPNRIGVVSVEAEYVGFSRMNVRAKNDVNWSDAQTGSIQDEFKDVLNLKAGIELRKGIARLRGGVNVNTDPLRYAEEFNAKKNIVAGSLGIGIRNSNFFADLSYSRFISSGAYTPYWVQNPDLDYYSVGLRQARGTVGLTVGSFF